MFIITYNGKQEVGRSTSFGVRDFGGVCLTLYSCRLPETPPLLGVLDFQTSWKSEVTDSRNYIIRLGVKNGIA